VEWGVRAVERRAEATGRRVHAKERKATVTEKRTEAAEEKLKS